MKEDGIRGFKIEKGDADLKETYVLYRVKRHAPLELVKVRYEGRLSTLFVHLKFKGYKIIYNFSYETLRTVKEMNYDEFRKSFGGRMREWHYAFLNEIEIDENDPSKNLEELPQYSITKVNIF